MFRILVSRLLLEELLLNRNRSAINKDLYKRLWNLISSGKVESYITPLTLDHIHLLCLHLKGEEGAEHVISKLKKFLRVCMIEESSIIEQSRKMDIQRFEAATELFCAQQISVDAILSLFTEDFENADIRTMLAEEFVNEYDRVEKLRVQLTLSGTCQIVAGKSDKTCQLHPSEEIDPMSYMIRNKMETVLKVFNVLKEKGSQGISQTELSDITGYTSKTLQSIIWDLQNLHMTLPPKRKKVMVKPNLVQLEQEELIEYLHSTLKNHKVMQIVYEYIEPGKQMTRWFLQELIHGLRIQDQPLKGKSLSDYTSKLLPWFFQTGLLEDRGRGIIVRPVSPRKLVKVDEVIQLPLCLDEK